MYQNYHHRSCNRNLLPFALASKNFLSRMCLKGILKGKKGTLYFFCRLICFLGNFGLISSPFYGCVCSTVVVSGPDVWVLFSFCAYAVVLVDFVAGLVPVFWGRNILFRVWLPSILTFSLLVTFVSSVKKVCNSLFLFYSVTYKDEKVVTQKLNLQKTNYLILN